MHPAIIESDQTAKVAKALFKAKAKIPGITRNKLNAITNSTFASLDHIQDLVIPVLRQHDIDVRHQTVTEPGLAGVLTRLVHVSSGEYIGSLFTLPSDGTPFVAGALVTRARRYNLVALLDLQIEDEDDDAELATRHAGERSRSDRAPGTRPGNRTTLPGTASLVPASSLVSSKSASAPSAPSAPSGDAPPPAAPGSDAGSVGADGVPAPPSAPAPPSGRTLTTLRLEFMARVRGLAKLMGRDSARATLVNAIGTADAGSLEPSQIEAAIGTADALLASARRQAA